LEEGEEGEEGSKPSIVLGGAQAMRGGGGGGGGGGENDGAGAGDDDDETRTAAPTHETGGLHDHATRMEEGGCR